MSFCNLHALEVPGDKVVFIFIDFTMSMSIVHPLSRKLSLMVAAAWRDVAQLKGEGAAFVESKVCSLIFQFWSCPFQVHRQV